ncbi:RNA-binding RNA annealing protein [Recurvomyces mirabilis]|uniref:RNA-binding RNA annealing protein n=1 Tax=Recurvomyces mirabilis TaxID=574656 RepID=A0AAE0WU64_9PEZI|nr:RNA-binding RNA annealing protein [Recurvomyces mirabilis]KAK5160664.1 RNA-binding RNA annealing protein [Recurvomyces mirabilis]
MSGKLDQSLDTIMAETGANKGGRGRRRAPQRAATRATSTTTAAPSGGIQKATKAIKAPTAPAVQPRGDGKVMVSNLPQDITETQLKDFFGKAIGGVRKVLLAYGPNGRSRGDATVIFTTYNRAAEAVKAYNGIKVDNRPMRIELVGGTVPVSAPKALADRMAKPKNAAKENAKKPVAGKAVGAKPVNNGEAAKGGRGKKSGRSGRPKAKTAEELDAEMQDYFNPNGEATGAAPAAINGGDAVMQTDEVL